MKKVKPPSSRRAEIQHLYESYASGQSTLPACDLVRFLHKEQMELTANQETAESLIERYEIEETARESRCLTFEGFLRYMESKDCCVFDQTHASVYQDMDQPLTSYFISSSHNTYLTGDQLVGKSHLDAYVCALRKGCRCLEIDCWDGPDMEPVVYHGYTLTTKILFRDVIKTVEQHAFEVSACPVILSLENHCSKEQQEVMAQYLISILGEKLLRAPLDHLTTGDLPSPNDLKYKILIKNKKLKNKAEGASGTEIEESVDEGEDGDEEDEEDEDFQTTSKFWSARKAGPKKKKVVVAKVLSDLVIYTTSVKFVSFSYSKDNQSCYENTSLAEKKACKLARSSGADFVQHNQKFLCRIYPAASRTSSSNYNPQEFWNVGSQLGESESERVISGSNLPIPRSGKALDPFVRVEINGIASDSCRKNTHTVKHNSLTPHWDADMIFNISVPELCLVRFCVRDHTGFLSSDFVGQYTLPFSSLKKGYRWVPLLSRDGCSLDPASLFVFVWYS
nr:PREDICTED: 1-phosphatidylinositol 4,5-bisphosphate phosphodiesterase zeta-1-like [Paralichthys olivaceus]